MSDRAIQTFPMPASTSSTSSPFPSSRPKNNQKKSSNSTSTVQYVLSMPTNHTTPRRAYSSLALYIHENRDLRQRLNRDSEPSSVRPSVRPRSNKRSTHLYYYYSSPHLLSKSKKEEERKKFAKGERIEGMGINKQGSEGGLD